MSEQLNAESDFMRYMADRISEARHGRKRGGVRTAPPAPTPPPATKESYTRAEIARMLGVSVPTVISWELPEFRRGQVVRILREDYEQFVRDHREVSGGKPDQRP